MNGEADLETTWTKVVKYVYEVQVSQSYRDSKNVPWHSTYGHVEQRLWKDVEIWNMNRLHQEAALAPLVPPERGHSRELRS